MTRMSASAIKTRQRRARLGRPYTSPVISVGQRARRERPDTDVRYPLLVSERKVDREAWAHEVARLIEVEANGNKSAFCRLTGISSVRNIDRWLARSVNVSEESVRQVARALNIPVVDLLVKVGYYRTEELPDAPSRQVIEGDETAIRFIEESGAPPALKREFLEHLERQKAEHERQRLEEIKRMIDLARRTGGAS